MKPDEKILINRERRRWEESLAADEELVSKLLEAIRGCLPKDLIVSDFEICPVTWGNIPLSVKYNSDKNPSHWMWAKSVYIPGFLKIFLLNTVAEIVFKGRRVEINRDIDFNKIVGALEELLTPMWPVQSFCIVAHKDSTTYVYQFYKGRPLSINSTSNKLVLDLRISKVYQYLEH